MIKVWHTGHSGNLFLDSLPADVAQHLGTQMTYSELPLASPIASLGAPIESAIFPVSGVISTVVRMADGTDVETALIGHEGFFGLAIVLGHGSSHGDAMVQIAGGVWHVGAGHFAAALEARAALKRRALVYTQLTIQTIGQFAACNRLHSIEQRLARWLLMAHDRIPDDVIALTQEFLATMLGVRRPGVTIAAGSLERAGLISYQRGAIRINDRPRLREIACECYGATCGFTETLLGYSPSKDRASRV